MLDQTRPAQTSDGTAGLLAKRVVDSTSVLGDLPDLLLVERMRGRDPRAFETLMRRYNRRLFRIARSILRDNDAAEEAASRAYVHAFANLDHYEPAGKLGAWLARLAFNEALTLRKMSAGSVSRTNTPPLAPILGPIPAPPAAAPAGNNAAGRQLLEAAIDALPEVFRTVLVLRVIEDLSGVEVAVCLRLHETTVRTRLYRAQRRLKEVAQMLRAEPFYVFELTAQRSDRIVQQVLAQLPVTAPSAEAR
jgi:RNA polymerase sigma-70 factor (ECF subfamily)